LISFNTFVSDIF